MRKAAAEYDNVGIEHVDHRGQASREALGVPRKCGGGFGITVRARCNDLRCVQRAAGKVHEIGGEARAREPGLDATALAAITWRPGEFVGTRPGQRVVAPLAGNRVDACERKAVDRDAAADARARDDAEDHVRSRSRSIEGFGER